MAFTNYTVSRTQPVPLGVQGEQKSIPVVITNEEGFTLNVSQTQPPTEVALSLLGIPRSETALGVFADITTYGINPDIWTSTPIVYGAETATGVLFLQNQSAASVEARYGNWASLNTNRAFPYLPGRVSSGTFGVRSSFGRTSYDDNQSKATIRKWGMLTDKDGYYFEIYGNGTGQFTVSPNPDQGTSRFHVVRRTSGVPVGFFRQNYQYAYIEPDYTNFAELTAGVTVTRILSAPYMVVVDSLSCFHAALHDPRLQTTSDTASSVKIQFQHNGETKTIFTYQTNALIYEYRVPRDYFGFDKLDGLTDSPVLYSDVVTVNNVVHYPGDNTGTTDTSVHTIDFSKTTMYKVEYSWYGAVGALFLSYVPVSYGDARWVKVHHLRGSNQLSMPTLGNPYLPISYFVYNSASDVTEALEKYGASYYIDGAEKGSVKVFSAFNTTPRTIGTGIKFPSQITSLSATNRNLFIETSTASPYIVLTGLPDQVFTSYYLGAYIDGTITYIDASKAYKTVVIPSGKVYIADVKIQKPAKGVYTDVQVLTSYAFLNVGVLPTTEWSALSANLRLFTPRATPLTNLRMKREFGVANVSSKATVFPSRLNIGIDLPANVDSGIVRVIKNAIFPETNLTTDAWNTNPGTLPYLFNRNTCVSLSADVIIPAQVSRVKVPIIESTYINVGQFVSGYIQGIAGTLTRTADAYYFQRIRDGVNAICTGTNTLGTITASRTTRGPDQFMLDPGYTQLGVYSGVLGSYQTSDVFSAVQYNVDEGRLPLYGTGNIIASFAVPAGGSDFDLSTFFDFNREFLAGAGLSTGTVLQEQLTITGQLFYPDETFEGGSSGDAAASITWEEQ